MRLLFVPAISTVTGPRQSWTDKGLRDKVGAAHVPLPTLLRSFVDAGFVLDSFREGGQPTPTVLAIKALKAE